MARNSVAELSSRSQEEVLDILKTSKNGLSGREASRRLKTYGSNEFEAAKKFGPVVLFISRFKSPLLILLLLAAVISGFLGSVIDSLIIVIIVVSSVAVDFFNTYKSEKAARKLSERVNLVAGVWRDGELREKKIKEIVPGDIVNLEAGDIVPADSMLLDGKDIFVSEGVLTGESLPVEKGFRDSAAKVLWMGTSVVSGRGVAMVVATGRDARIGTIAGMLHRPEVPTEFDKDLKNFSFFIFRITVVLVLSILLVDLIFERKSPIEVFLFAVAIAVGITPELLPMIITANLAKGALRMSEKGVIVKKLSAIYNFGGIDTICTDKTGTLTEDKITLMKYLDPAGNEDEKVLFWGYVSSIHITSVRGALDKALQEFSVKGGSASGGRKIEVGNWTKVDELPFDSVRRRDSVAVTNGSETMLVLKGAPEEVLKISSYYRSSREPLGESGRKNIYKIYEDLSADGFRVLGLAVKSLGDRRVYQLEDESSMGFLGFLAFLDPAKRGVKSTLEKLSAYGINIKVITGDNHIVTERIAKDINLKVTGVLKGEEIALLGEAALRNKVEEVNLFTRVSPEQKQTIIQALRANGHVVGYLGDGVNDVLSLKEADVGISVNNAIDIAKETADIILIRKGLAEVIDGIAEGRKTFANTFKYLMMALSSNFGNMFSMPIASLFLNFLPMTPSQILLNNFIYDSSQLAIPFDNVDESFMRKAKKFDMEFMKKFMIIFGPLSSLFDLLTFLVLSSWLGFSGAGFQTGWFLESIATQTLVVGIIRTRGSFFKSRIAPVLLLSSLGAVFVGWVLPHLKIANLFGFAAIGWKGSLAMALIVILYLFSVEMAKKWFYARYGYLIEK